MATIEFVRRSGIQRRVDELPDGCFFYYEFGEFQVLAQLLKDYKDIGPNTKSDQVKILVWPEEIYRHIPISTVVKPTQVVKLIVEERA